MKNKSINKTGVPMAVIVVFIDDRLQFGPERGILTKSIMNRSINQSKRNTSNVQNLTHLGHEHQAPDHEATQPMMGY
jgi:hypothetical protein